MLDLFFNIAHHLHSCLSLHYYLAVQSKPVSYCHANHYPSTLTRHFCEHWIFILTHWGQVMHICVGNLTIIGPDNGLSPFWRQAIIWTNAGILLIGPLGTNFSEILIGIQAFSFKKLHLKTSSAKWHLFCLCLNELMLMWYQHVMPISTSVKVCNWHLCCLISFH